MKKTDITGAPQKKASPPTLQQLQDDYIEFWKAVGLAAARIWQPYLLVPFVFGTAWQPNEKK